MLIAGFGLCFLRTVAIGDKAWDKEALGGGDIAEAAVKVKFGVIKAVGQGDVLTKFGRDRGAIGLMDVDGNIALTGVTRVKLIGEL